MWRLTTIRAHHIFLFLGICKIIPPYVDDVFSGRSKFKDVDFTMEVRKQPLKMVDWDKKENTLKGVDFNKDKK